MRALLITLGAVAAIIVGLALGTPTGRYLIRAGWEEGRILGRRRPIPAVIGDPGTSPDTRAKLEIVVAARSFAESIGLKPRGSFTTYSAVDHDTLVMVLGAAYRDKLQSFTWWFPIVGRVPYKGYFDFAAAERAAATMRQEGFDAYARPSAAFSTLGFFDDPVVSASLNEDTIEVANTVIHELTHNTFFPAGQATFNESFANFVGSRGAEAFFRARGDTAAARMAADRWDDDKILGRFWTSVYLELDSAFTAHPTDKAARLAVRETIFARTRERLIDSIGPLLKTYDRASLPRARIDNAALMARRVYHTNLDGFDAIYARMGNDLRAAVAWIIAHARKHPGDPFASLTDPA